MGTTEFLLNDRHVEAEASGGTLVLDWLRRNQRLVGTKEGCKEGDCGACAVLVGEMEDSGGRVRYEPVTSCLIPMGEMHGRHLVTIEGMNLGPGELSPVQRAIVENGGTQCGFCTPGFVVSMTWYLMAEREEPTLEGFQRAISGNLCRCTGYTSLNRAGEALIERFSEGGEWEEIWQADDRIGALADEEMIPAYFRDVAERLEAIEAPETTEAELADYLVAGGTDIYVQEGEELPKHRVAVLNNYPEMRGIRREAGEPGEFRIGALTSFEQFAQDGAVRELIPDIDEHMFLIASLHIRNRATLGGNIVNASPIGDMTNFLLALGGELVLRGGGEERRRVAMEDFFLDYKQLNKREDELVTEVVFPAGRGDTRVNFEKIAKRKALDIATVCSGARMEADEQGTLESVRIAVGGVAPIPLLLEETNAYLEGRTITPQTVRGAVDVAMGEIAPISDVRGSAGYKRLLTRQCILSHFLECYPERVEFTELAG